MWRKGNSVHCLWQCILIQPLSNSLKFPQKIKKKKNPATELLAIYPKKMRTLKLGLVGQYGCY